MSVYRLEFPAPCEWLSANDTRNLYQLASLRKAWRETTYLHAKAARLPTGLHRVRVDAVLRFTTKRHRDEANYQATLKPCVDALGPRRFQKRNGRPVLSVGYGLIPDDTPQHLDGPYITFGDLLPKGQPGRIELLITDLSGEAL